MAKRMMKKMMDKNCMGMMQRKHKCMASGMVVLGILVLANVYLSLVNWATFVGIVLILGGLAKLIMYKKNMM